MTYWRITSGEQPFLTSATMRKVSSTSADSAESAPGSDGGNGIGNRLFQCRCMDPRVLPDVERMQMQTEGAYLQDQRIDQCARDAQPLMRRKRRAQRFKVVEKFLNGAVGRQHLRQFVLALREGKGHDRQRAARCVLIGLFQRSLDTRLEADDEAAIVLELVLRTEDLRFGRVHLRHISLQAIEQRVADLRLLRAVWSAGR